MLFEEIVLENFATYIGRNVINLLPISETKPVILIGGENGCGKTSLLDAFQLVLLGPSAKCSNRGRLSYHDYLKQCMNRDAPADEGSVLELTFQFNSGGKTNRYKIRRSWSVKNQKINERFSVFRDDCKGKKFDSALSSNWIDFVEGIFPSEVAPFFLFDGEKIEQLADFEKSGPLIHSAINSLLGLNHVNQLTTDLQLLEKRTQKSLAPLEQKISIEAKEEQLKEINELISTLKTDEARLNNGIDRKKVKLENIEIQYKQQGGDLYDRRSEIEVLLKQQREYLKIVEDELREFAAGTAPFVLVENLLYETREQSLREQLAHKLDMLNSELLVRDTGLVETLKSFGFDSIQINKVREYLVNDRTRRKCDSEVECYLELSDTNLNRLSNLFSDTLPKVKEETPQRLNKLEEVRTKVEDNERSLAAVPDDIAIAEIINERDNLIDELRQLEFQVSQNNESLRKAKYEKGIITSSLQKELEAAAERRFEGKDKRRLLDHSAKSRETLQIFKKRVIQKHIGKIEKSVMESFRQLLRKESLVCGLKIDPSTYNLSIVNSDDTEICPDRLSAGERQLLATALLWGICKVAGKPLPTIIDTPLGRLDTSHRTNLVSNYFPNASHQVLLLSTNEEIVGQYHTKLEPYISHHYILNHDELMGGTTVAPGYFSKT